MPWRETSPMDQKTQFIADYLRETSQRDRAVRPVRISRKTAYKWIDRYLRQGPEVWKIDRASRATPQTARRAHRSSAAADAGAAPELGREEAAAPWLQRSERTCPGQYRVRDAQAPRHDRAKRQATRSATPGGPSADARPQRCVVRRLQGAVPAGDGRYCYPLTVTDGYSRYLLGCQGLQ